jgi:hypothetical protein
MNDEEMLFKQVQMTAAATKGTTVWVYRNTVYAYPWYSSVRKTLEDPAYADWYFKFKPEGPWFSKKCDSAQPDVCSDFYHSQEQSPGYPHGDGDCAAPGCDCGTVPCGFYIWNHSSTTVVNGQTFQDWFVNDYILNHAVGRSPLVSGTLTHYNHTHCTHTHCTHPHCTHMVSGFFWDDVWNPDCQIHDQVKNTCEDMGFTKGDPRLVQLTKDYQANMAVLRNATLTAGKFAWQMLWTGGADDSIGGTGLGPHVHKSTCASDLRQLCQATSPAQTRAMGYGFNTPDPKELPDLMEDIANFLLIRGPYSFLGHGWRGCSKEYLFPYELNMDYGTPSGLCTETAPKSGVFTRDWSRVTVSMDCNTYTPSFKWKVPTPAPPPTPPTPLPPPPTPSTPTGELLLRNYVGGKSNRDTAPCAARSSGSCSVYTKAGYTLLQAEALVWPKQIEEPGVSLMKRIDGVYDGAKDDNSLSDGSSAFSPAGYANETSMGETFYVFESPANVTVANKEQAGREGRATVALVPIDVYYSKALGDHWVLATAKSRTEATAKGYEKVGTLGYGLPP